MAATCDVFISNAGSENELARALCELLRRRGIGFFHYRWDNTIELGSPWPDELRTRLRSSKLFVPLLTGSYWESEVCREEYRIAEALSGEGRLRVLPYFLDDATGPRVVRQGRRLRGLPRGRQLDLIAGDVEGSLTSDATPTPPARHALVGREPEMRALRDALAAARDGLGQLVLLGGEPGIGKTRLARELAREAVQEGFLDLWATCWADGGAAEFGPWIQLILDCVRAGRPVTGDAARRWEDELIASLLPDVAPAGPLAAVPVGWGPQDDGFRSFPRIAQLFREAAAMRPLLLVLDNLHLADAASLRLLRHLAGEVHRSSMVVLGTYRDTEVSGSQQLAELLSQRGGSVHHRVVRGLDERATAGLVEVLCGRAVDDAAARTLLQQTGGNPLFVREVLQLEADIRAQPPPALDGVRDVIARRLQWVSPRCLEMVGVASVIGDEFRVRLLRAAWEPGGADLAAELDEAVRRRLAVPMDGDEPRYRFSHPLIREVVAERLDHERRALLHARVADAIEQLFPHELEQRASQLAHHLRRAGPLVDAGRALAVMRRAGERAFRRGAYEQAADHLSAALRIAESERTGDAATLCELLLRLARARMAAGQPTEARASYGRVADLARTHGLPGPLVAAALGVHLGIATGLVDDLEIRLLTEALEAVGRGESTERARLLARLAVALRDTASIQHRTALCAEALAIARRLGDEATLAAVLFDRHTSLFGERAEDRLATTEEIVAIATRIGDDQLALEGRAMRLGNLMALGEMDRFGQEVEVYRRLTVELAQPQFHWRVEFLRATQDVLAGRLDQAERRLAAGVELGLRVEYEHVQVHHGAVLGVIRYLQGRLHELEPVLRLMAARWPTAYDWQAAMALALVDAGRADEARHVFERLAVDEFSCLSRSVMQVPTLAILAAVCDALGDARRAATLSEALAPYAGRNLAFGQIAIACLGPAAYYLGLLACTRGRWQDACAHFEAATACCRRIGAPAFMANSCAQHARALRALGGPKALGLADEQARRAEELASALGLGLWRGGAAGPTRSSPTRRTPSPAAAPTALAGW